MAILITDNLLVDHSVHITGVGAAWTGLDRLTAPQLDPHATWGNGTAVGLDITGLPALEAGDGWALVLLAGALGASADFPGASLVWVVAGPGGGLAITPDAVYTLAAPVGVHTVVTLNAGVGSTGALSVRWDAGGSPGQLGGLYLGRVHNAPELADAGWSIGYTDQQTSSQSYGGQIYHASAQPQMVREARIPAGTLDEARAVSGSDSLAGIYTRHGHTRPIIAMPRPSTPTTNRATGIYGHITGGSTITHTTGPYYGTALRITEAL